MIKPKSITIWCENINAMYSAKWITKKYVNKNYKVYLFTFQKNLDTAKSYFEEEVKIIAIESIDRYFLKILHSLISLILVHNSFSSMFNRIRKNRGLIANYIGSLKRPKYFAKNFNNLYHKFFSIFPNKLPTILVVSFTRPSKPYLISSSKIRHISIMESWDHPAKAPYFLKPQRCLAWNKPLADDIRIFQKINKISYIKPLKLNYVLEYEKELESDLFRQLDGEYKSELIDLDGCKYVLYPTSTSSINPAMHEGELLLIEYLIKCCDREKIKLYLKPKPNGPQGDYDHLAKNPNVKIGVYSKTSDNKDMLNNNYHIFRFLLLKRSSLVINAYTTFVIEAALASKPILQLKLLNSQFGNFSQLAKNYHIQKYLFPDHLIHSVESKEINIIKSIEDMRYTNYLKEWLNKK